MKRQQGEFPKFTQNHHPSLTGTSTISYSLGKLNIEFEKALSLKLTSLCAFTALDKSFGLSGALRCRIAILREICIKMQLLSSKGITDTLGISKEVYKFCF